jgi:hypothetical protein
VDKLLSAHLHLILHNQALHNSSMILTNNNNNLCNNTKRRLWHKLRQPCRGKSGAHQARGKVPMVRLTEQAAIINKRNTHAGLRRTVAMAKCVSQVPLALLEHPVQYLLLDHDNGSVKAIVLMSSQP